MSTTKTEHMCVNKGSHDGVGGQVKMQGQVVPEVENFQYLGPTIACDGRSDGDVKKRIQAGWNNWRKVTGLVCDKKVLVRLKGCIHKAVVRPAILYGMETVPLNKGMVKIDVYGRDENVDDGRYELIRRKKIRNEVVRGKLGVREVSAMVKENCLRWYGHVRTREESYVGRMSDGERDARKEKER